MVDTNSAPKPWLRRPALLVCISLTTVSLLAVLIVSPLRGQAPREASSQTSTASPARDVGEGRLLQRLWQDVLGLRNRCAVEGMSGWNAFVTPAAANKLEQINRQLWAEEADRIWSYFFARALFDIGRPASPAPLVGFYHPWADAWLLLEWQLKPEPRITDIELVSGEWVRRRGEPPFDLRPEWLRRDGFRVEQLARAVVDNLKLLPQLAYGKQPWREALQLERYRQQLDAIHTPAIAVNLTGAMLRAEELALGAAAFDKDHPPPAVLEQLLESCRRFIASGREGNAGFFIELAESTSPATAAAVRKLSAESYRQLAPVYWLADEQWAEALLVPDHNPDFCLALTYRRLERRLQLTRIDLVHFPSVAAALRKQGGR
jgi:hypothetical protein